MDRFGNFSATRLNCGRLGAACETRIRYHKRSTTTLTQTTRRLEICAQISATIDNRAQRFLPLHATTTTIDRKRQETKAVLKCDQPSNTILLQGRETNALQAIYVRLKDYEYSTQHTVRNTFPPVCPLLVFHRVIWETQRQYANANSSCF